MVNSERKKIKKQRYIAAFAITLLIFALGLMMGLVMESKRVDYITNTANKQRLDYTSLQLQYQFIDQLTQEKDCNAILKTFDNNLKSLDEIRVKIEEYTIDSTLREDDFHLLSREYTIAQLRYYLLAEKTKDTCNNDIVTALYFYSDEKNCPRCKDQGFILTYMKNRMEDNLLIFSLNHQLATEEPLIQMMLDRYNVTQYPTIVIDDEIFDEPIDKVTALTEVCQRYEQNYTFCEGYQ